MKCTRKDCGRDATHVPVLSFASVQRPDGPRATGRLSLYVCREHQSTDVDEYVTDEGWQQIVDTLKRAGKAHPSRATLRVHFEPIL